MVHHQFPQLLLEFWNAEPGSCRIPSSSRPGETTAAPWTSEIPQDKSRLGSVRPPCLPNIPLSS